MGEGYEFNLQVESGWKSSRCTVAIYRIVSQTDGYLHCLFRASNVCVIQS